MAEVLIGEYLNFHYISRDPARAEQASVLLESGINAVAPVKASDGVRRPFIALRSSPWKMGTAATPWHDEYDLDHGHVRYFGDHKVSTLGPVGTTRGNRWLLEAWELHAATEEAARAQAPPLLLFRSVPVHDDRRRIDKGHVEFCGVGVMERLEFIVQRDPGTGKTFPNLAIDINVIRLGANDELDWRWLDALRNPGLTTADTLALAPEAWRRWVARGRAALPGIRRRVLSSRVLSAREQLPDPDTRQHAILDSVYHAFDENKHAFEMLASLVAEKILSDSGAHYRAGWLTRAGGDGGMDFVGRLDVGATSANAPLVVLGQAKCIDPRSSISPDQVARLVARLRRGWIGIFVTTGTFSRQAQVEIVDDEYPVVLVNGRTLADTVFRITEESFSGDLGALISSCLDEYPSAVTPAAPTR